MLIEGIVSDDLGSQVQVLFFTLPLLGLDLKTLFVESSLCS